MQIAVRPVNQIFYLLKDVEISLHYMWHARTKEEFWHHNFHDVSFDCFKGDSTLLAMKQNS